MKVAPNPPFLRIREALTILITRKLLDMLMRIVAVNKTDRMSWD
jgi:hypothetical protein